MCGFGSSPKAPAAPPRTPEAPRAPAVTGTASDADRRRRAAAAGQTSTILTGSQGVTGQATTSQKTLLGQ